MKPIVDRHTCESLLTLIRMGKVRVIKEYGKGDPVLSLTSASGLPIGIIGEKYKYLFEAALIEHGSGDGLFEGHSQTTTKGT